MSIFSNYTRTVILFGLIFKEVCPNAKNVCLPIRSPYFGKLHGQCGGNFGDVCYLNCTEKFSIHGNPFKTCNATTGNWEPTGAFSCQDRSRRCHGLKLPSHGNLRRPCSNFVGSSCYIGCDAGYSLVGSERVVCLPSTLKWAPSIPKCNPLLCPTLTIPDHGSLVSDDCKRYLGANCEFSCNTGYYLIGSKYRTCTRAGFWTGKTTRCAKICPGLTPGSHFHLRYQCSPGVSGFPCHIICDKGFQLDQPYADITCTDNGTWNRPRPKCIRKTCPNLASPENGDIFGECKPGIFGFPCIFTCRYGYRLLGEDNSLCKADSKWSNPVPLCKEITCNSVISSNVIDVEGDCQPGFPHKWCKVNCIPGYEISGQDNVTCTISGMWMPNDPVCQKKVRCPPLQPPENGFFDEPCTSKVNATCHQICNPDYVSMGPSYKTCLPSGEWDAPDLLCISKNGFKTDNGT